LNTKFLLILGCFIVLASCGTRKVAEGNVNFDKKTREVVVGHESNEPEFKTLEASLRGSYENEDQDRSISLNLRIKKNETIWLSAKFAGLIPVAKILITKDRVRYYEKINGIYFDGNFKELSDWLGTDLDFKKVQNLLIGQALYSLRSENWQYSISERGYQLKSEPGKTIAKTFFIKPGSFRLLGEQLVREAQKQSVTVTYPEYQKIGEEAFPKKIEIIANQKADNTKISINYRSVNFDVNLSFPYEVPDSYEKTEIID